MPVQEVLLDETLTVDKLIVAQGSRGNSLDRILGLAERQGVPIEWTNAQRVKLLAGNGKHDQGIVADVEAPGLRTLEEYVAEAPYDAGVLLLDGITNPGNVGMIIRTATAAGLAVILPSQGTASLGPLVIKASAGVAYRATIVRVRRAPEAVKRLHAAGFTTYGLDSEAATSLYDGALSDRLRRGRSAFVLGNETDGLTDEVSGQLQELIAIPMSGGVESLNVASAAAVLSFELVRLRLAE